MAELQETAPSLRELQSDRLALLTAGGCVDAFPLLAERFAPVIGGILTGLSVPSEEREDLHQEGLIGLYKATLLFDPEQSSFSTFARLCIRSAVLDGLRRCRKDSDLLSETQDIPADRKEDPQRILVGKETLACLLKQTAQILSPMERRIFGLSLRGKSTKEIASITGKSAKSVDNTLFRCRAKLATLK